MNEKREGGSDVLALRVNTFYTSTSSLTATVFRILRHTHAVEVVSCFHMWIVDFISNLIYLLRSYDHVAWALLNVMLFTSCLTFH